MIDFLLLFGTIVTPFIALIVILLVLVFLISWIRKKLFNRGRSSTQGQNDQINHKHQQEVERQLEKLKIEQNEVLRQGQSKNRRL